MSVILNRIDNVPIQTMDFSVEFEQWLYSLVNNLNTTIQQIEDELNSLDARVAALEP